MKIVINDCFGGFSLSALAIKELTKRKGLECYFFDHKIGEEKLIPLTLEEASEGLYFLTYSVPNPEEYRISERGEDGTFKEANGRADKISIETGRGLNREDLDLIAVVEMLGKKANGRCADLKIVEIPDGVDYCIEEYDGAEHIAETHRTWH